MKVFSMFSGIGGFENGLKQAMPDIEIAGHSEINKYADMIYKYHYPESKNYGDCTKIVAEDLPDFDMLCGGSPCQSFSIAGKRKGFEDTRGTLVFEFIRIAKAKQPKYILWENVFGVLSHDNGMTFQIICESFCEIGYIIDFDCFNTKEYGIPQNRERIYVWAIRKDLLDKCQIF